MKTTQRNGNSIAAVRDLRSGELFSTNGQRGTVIRCLEGQAWVTQEGDLRDYFLAANTRFQATSRGSIVIHALVDATKIAVERIAPKPAGDWRHNSVRLEPGFTEAAHRLARRERTVMIAALTTRARWWLRRGVRRLAEITSSGLFSPRGRRSLHQ